MKSDLLHVVIPYANPMRWNNRRKIYELCKEHMLDSGVKLTIVECAQSNRPFELCDEPHINHIGVRSHHPLWIKEALLNIGFAHLPDNARYIAWIDGDIEFRRSNWASETVHALQQYDVIQPWSECYDLGPNDEHMDVHSSFCKLWFHNRPICQGPNKGKYNPYKFAHPGYGWAATRDALNNLGGLIDTAILGAADHHMALALIGRAKESIPNNCTEGYKKPIYQWQHRAMRHVNMNIGYIPGTIEHFWHGSKPKRAYVDRWDILIKHKFDPYSDLKRNIWGLPELTGSKPKLIHDIDLYFRARDEDSNTI